MKVALVLGCTGQVGSLLSSFLLNRDYRVVGVSRRTSSPTDWRLKELNILHDPFFTMCSGDITDQGSIERVIKEHQPDEIYNLAAQSYVGASWDSAVSTFDITGAGAVKVLDAVRNINTGIRVYQASSSEMYGGANRREVLNEKSTFDPQSPYGVAKVAAHHMSNVFRTSFNMFISCGIMFNNESPYRGEEFVTRKITKAAAEIYLGKRESLKLHNLDSVRDWGYTGDYVKAIHLMLQQDKPDDFVIATGVTHTIEELCEIAFDFFHIKDWRNRIVLTDERPADVKHLCGDASKAKKILGWQPTTGFRDMIRDMCTADLMRL